MNITTYGLNLPRGGSGEKYVGQVLHFLLTVKGQGRTREADEAVRSITIERDRVQGGRKEVKSKKHVGIRRTVLRCLTAPSVTTRRIFPR